MRNFITIPFKIESDSGVSTVEGLAKFSSAGIVLEFEKKLFGILNDGIKEARIPVGDILDIKLKSGVFDSKFERYFSNRIELRLNSLAPIAGLPYKNGRFKMNIKRADREHAEQAVSCIAAALSRPINIPEGESPKLPEASPIEQVFIENESDTLELTDKR